MRYDLVAAVIVVVQDGVGGILAALAMTHGDHGRNAEALDPHEPLLGIAFRGNKDEAVDPLVDQRLDRVIFQLRPLVGVGDDDAVAVSARFVLDPAQYARDDGLRTVGQDDADGPGRPGAQTAGHLVLAVVHLRGDLQDPPTGLIREPLFVVERLGYAHNRDAGFLCDFFQCDIFHLAPPISADPVFAAAFVFDGCILRMKFEA